MNGCLNAVRSQHPEKCVAYPVLAIAILRRVTAVNPAMYPCQSCRAVLSSNLPLSPQRRIRGRIRPTTECSGVFSGSSPVQDIEQLIRIDRQAGTTCFFSQLCAAVVPVGLWTANTNRSEGVRSHVLHGGGGGNRTPVRI